ncbi:MAG: hypothetical protein PHC53_05935 [Patescibacteria group bacterium]|nr:hypothetical protein [Patescibacteria group bacterium]
MNEKMPVFPAPENKPETKVEYSGEEQAAQWLKDHPELVAVPEVLKESGPEIAQFEGMIAAFEAEHPLEQLHQIVDLTVEQAPHHPIREPARLALIPIVAKLTAIKKDTDISQEKYEELKALYKRLSRAVGAVRNSKVDHQ